MLMKLRVASLEILEKRMAVKPPMSKTGMMMPKQVKSNKRKPAILEMASKLFLVNNEVLIEGLLNIIVPKYILGTLKCYSRIELIIDCSSMKVNCR